MNIHHLPQHAATKYIHSLWNVTCTQFISHGFAHEYWMKMREVKVLIYVAKRCSTERFYSTWHFIIMTISTTELFWFIHNWHHTTTTTDNVTRNERLSQFFDGNLIDNFRSCRIFLPFAFSLSLSALMSRWMEIGPTREAVAVERI